MQPSSGCVCGGVCVKGRTSSLLGTSGRTKGPSQVCLHEVLATHKMSALLRAQGMSGPKESTYHLCLSHSAREPIQEEAIFAGGGLQVLLNQLHHHLITHLMKEKGKPTGCSSSSWIHSNLLENCACEVIPATTGLCSQILFSTFGCLQRYQISKFKSLRFLINLYM